MIELECPVVGCNHGVAGEKYKMPKFDLYDAMSCTETYTFGKGRRQNRKSRKFVTTSTLTVLLVNLSPSMKLN